jgi:hypothetical protein
MTQSAGAPPGVPVADLPRRTFAGAQPTNIQGEGKAQVVRLVGLAYGERDGHRYYRAHFYATPISYPDQPSAITALKEYAKSIGVEPPDYLPFTVYTPDGRYYELVYIKSLSDEATDHEDA